MLRVEKVGQWPEVRNAMNLAGTRMGKAISLAIKQEANFLRDEIKSNLKSGGTKYGKGFKRLAKNTLAARKIARIRSTQPLKAKSKLINAIRTHRKGKNSYFIGVSNKVRASKGGRLADVAQKNEEGAKIIIDTAKVGGAYLRFLGYLFSKSGGSGSGGRKGRRIIVINIPARPFIQPVYDKLYSNRIKVKARVYKRVALNLGGIWLASAKKVR